MAKTKSVSFTVMGDAVRARATAEQALEAKRFRITWSDEWNAVAERGSKVANALAGAAAQYMKLLVSLQRGDTPDHTVIRLEKGSSGAMGGAIGVSRTRKNLLTLRDELAATFQAAGVLVSVAED
jgi:anti-sigma-K factor RskA